MSNTSFEDVPKCAATADLEKLMEKEPAGPYFKNSKIPIRKPADFNWNFFDFDIPQVWDSYVEEEENENSKPKMAITSSQLPNLIPEGLLPSSTTSSISDSENDMSVIVEKSKKSCAKNLPDDDSSEVSSPPVKGKKKKKVLDTTNSSFDDSFEEFSQDILDESEYIPSSQEIKWEKQTKRNNKNWSSKKNKWARYEMDDFD